MAFSFQQGFGAYWTGLIGDYNARCCMVTGDILNTHKYLRIIRYCMFTQYCSTVYDRSGHRGARIVGERWRLRIALPRPNKFQGLLGSRLQVDNQLTADPATATTSAQHHPICQQQPERSYPIIY